MGSATIFSRARVDTVLLVGSYTLRNLQTANVDTATAGHLDGLLQRSRMQVLARETGAEVR